MANTALIRPPSPTISTESGHILVTLPDGAQARLRLSDNHVTITPDITASWARTRLVDLSAEVPNIDDIEIAIARVLRDPEVLRRAEAHPILVLNAGGRPLAPGDPLGRDFGDANERVVLEDVRKVTQELEWVRAVRRATEEEDHRGLDIVVETDVCDLFIQVKSSHANAEEWRRRYKTAPTYSRTILVVMSIERDICKRRGRIRSELRRMYKASGGIEPEQPLAPPAPHPPTAPRHPLVPRILGNPASASPKYIANLIEVERVALARDQEKTRRMELHEDIRRTKEALRVATRALINAGLDEAVAQVTALAPWVTEHPRTSS